MGQPLIFPGLILRVRHRAAMTNVSKDTDLGLARDRHY